MIEIWINIIVNVLVALFLLIGTFFIVSSAIGIIRFPDVYTKLHAATKAPTLGIASILIGAFLFLYAAHGVVSGKLLLAIVFILLTSPVGGHMLSRAAHHAGVKPVTKNQPDDYAKALQQKQFQKEK
ncbi:MAG TPA: monovalent cation/H(+) antiporter subunit G [Bacillota bacterium]